MLHIIAVVAELERDLVRERTIAGIERVKARGEIGGRPKAMTDERAALASGLLGDGERGNKVWEAMKELPGPKISRAAYYAWQKQWDADRAAELRGDQSRYERTMSDEKMLGTMWSAARRQHVASLPAIEKASGEEREALIDRAAEDIVVRVIRCPVARGESR